MLAFPLFLGASKRFVSCSRNPSVLLRLILSLVPLALLPSLQAAFTDETESTGIDYVHADPSTELINHAGAAAVDVDGDGWTDFLAARAGERCLLFINQGDGTFVEEGESRGLGGVVGLAAFGAGDLDNDGDQDIYAVPHEGFRFYLFINDGTGNFVEQATPRGADVPSNEHKHEGYSVGLVDYNLDGYLDIYVSEWGVPSSTEDEQHSVLLRNRGELAPGFFQNVTEDSGLLQPVAREEHFGFSSGWADLDQDGWPDLALVADFRSSQMYWNDGDGTFTRSTGPSGMGLDENGKGVAIADYDADGLLDVYVTSTYDAVSLQRVGSQDGNKLYRNLGDRRFEEVADEVGVDRGGWGWGASFFEYDNDGDFDLVTTNGIDIAEGEDPDSVPFAAAASDPTTLFVNEGDGTFVNATEGSGITDTDLGKAVVVLDYDRDGDEDLIITNTFGSPIVYRSDASESGNEWLRIKFVGTRSNRDGIGAVVKVTDSGQTQTLAYNPTNAYIGQREAFLHYGLGDAGGAVDRLEVLWPSGLRQELTDVSANQVLEVNEPDEAPDPPAIVTQPVGGTFEREADVEIAVEVSGSPMPVFVWLKNGEILEGQSRSRLFLERIQPFDEGVYQARAISPNGEVLTEQIEVEVTEDLSKHSVARWWNEFMLEGIRKDFPDPTVHARNLYHTSAAMWDAFWAYETDGWEQALPVFHREDVAPADWGGDRLAAQREAISHAAFRVLTHRYAHSPGRERTLFGFRWLMEELGFDPDNDSTVGMSPAAVGNRIGFLVIEQALEDGSNEINGYADPSGYEPVNPPLVFELSGTELNDANRWQPLAFDFLVTQNGIPVGEAVQTFLGVNWRAVQTFALPKPTPITIGFDPGPPPLVGTETEAEYIDAGAEVVRFSSWLDPNDGVEIDISPAARLNNTLGLNDGVGRAINPYTGEPYEPNIVKRGDYGRILAEFWADGPASETPPGHWNTLHNEVTDHPLFERRYAGRGEELSALEWDVRAYLTLNGAMHDAAVAAWTLKRQYDYIRPISIIRFMGGLGQSSDPDGLSYHPQGLPLEEGVIEVITEESSAAGERHEQLADHVGKIALRCWAGEPNDPETQVGGVDWILAVDWMPYQRDTFVTPSFAAYVSGHSTFSRAAAEVMTLLTGTPFFPGGMGEFHFEKNEYLEFENGPSEDVTLQWATYYDAADQAGLSRLYGGIHVRADDFVGRVLGARVGLEAFLKAQSLTHGAAPPRGLVNISARGRTGTGDDLIIVGFVTRGEGETDYLARAVGPGLASQGVTNVVQDPNFELMRKGSADPLLIADDWGAAEDPDAIRSLAASSGAFALPDGSADAAAVVPLSRGVYSVLTRGGGAGADDIVLTEVYGSGFVNISSRAKVGRGEGSLIAGFVIRGYEPNAVLIRGVGPGLAAQGVTNWLEDPKLSLFRHLPGGGIEPVATNDDWILDDRASLAEVSALRMGAFPLELDSRDAALFLQLPRGVYSAVLSSKTSQEGIGLVEVYHGK